MGGVPRHPAVSWGPRVETVAEFGNHEVVVVGDLVAGEPGAMRRRACGRRRGRQSRSDGAGSRPGSPIRVRVRLGGFLHVARHSDAFGFDMLAWLPVSVGTPPRAVALEVKSSRSGTTESAAACDRQPFAARTLRGQERLGRNDTRPARIGSSNQATGKGSGKGEGKITTHCGDESAPCRRRSPRRHT